MNNHITGKYSSDPSAAQDSIQEKIVHLLDLHSQLPESSFKARMIIKEAKGLCFDLSVPSERKRFGDMVALNEGKMPFSSNRFAYTKKKVFPSRKPLSHRAWQLRHLCRPV